MRRVTCTFAENYGSEEWGLTGTRIRILCLNNYHNLDLHYSGSFFETGLVNTLEILNQDLDFGFQSIFLNPYY